MPERLWQALQAPERQASVAVRDSYGVLTYAQLWQAITARAEQLRALDIRRLGLYRDNGRAWLIDDLAALYAGVLCVPIPLFFTPAQVSHLLATAALDGLSGAQWPGFAPVAADLYQRSVVATPLPQGCVKVTFTSGSTASPKGVCLSAAQLLNVAAALQQATAAAQVAEHLCVLPLATLLENVAGVYTPLLAGAAVQVPSLQTLGWQGGGHLDAACFLAALANAQPHSLILLPQLLKLLVQAAEHGRFALPSLRFAAVGGAQVAPALLARAQALGWPVVEGYGLSEAASVVCLNPLAAPQPGTVGLPLAHVQVQLAEDGEVLVCGNTFLGYLGDSQAQPKWLATGDLGQWQNGYLRLIGRKKNQFITAYGRNVNPEWVEAELLQHPGITQAWVCGEAAARNRALLVLSPGADATQVATWVAAANQTLPDYAQVHDWQIAEHPFTSANGLLTANGRLRRSALLARYPLTDITASAVQEIS